MDREFEMVKSFHEKFGHPVGDIPGVLDRDRLKKRVGWIIEELQELLKESSLSGQVRELADVLYFVLGTLVEIGVHPGPVFRIIHTCNMNKLNKDGNPIYDENGKVRKPDDWQSPKKKIEEFLDELVKG